jgi:hypothetical protein
VNALAHNTTVSSTAVKSFKAQACRHSGVHYYEELTNIIPGC